MANQSNTLVIFLLRICFVLITVSDLLHVSAYGFYRPIRRQYRNGTLTPNEVRTVALYKILDEMPQNELFHSKSCGIMEQELPDFRAPNRRVSEVKCLEQLWKIRFYDQLLLKKVRCKSDVEGAYVTFAIYEDNVVSTGKFAHTGAVGWESVGQAWIFLCGATLISDRYFITAAHCSTSNDFRVADPTPKIIRLGDKNILDSDERKKTPMDVYIKDVIVPDNYRPPAKYNDIALIELEEAIPFKVFSNPSCLWSYNDIELFGRGYESGWGIVESDSERRPKYQIADLELINTNVCSDKLNQIFHTNLTKLPHQVCAAYLDANDTCKGDSGGPLMMSLVNQQYSDFTVHFIVGIQSTSYGCDSPNFPNVYTRVSSFINWIEEVVWSDDVYTQEILSEKKFAKIYAGL